MLMPFYRVTLLCGAMMISCAHAWAQFDSLKALSHYDVVWQEPGKGSFESMPLGNGDIGLNVWTELNGDVVFTIGKTDAWTEIPNTSWGLAKVGQLRVHVDTAAPRTPFLQVLRLASSEIEVRQGEIRLRLWVDANHPEIHVEMVATQAATMRITLEDWRQQAPANPSERGTDSEAVSPWRTVPDGRITADAIENEKNALEWYHRNGPKSDSHVANYTWGARVTGTGLIGVGRELSSARPATKQQVTVSVLTTTDGSESRWKEQIRLIARADTRLDAMTAWKAHTEWWKRFWERSWVFVDGDEDAERVTQGYVLQRYVSAASGRGAHAIKFNGSLFVMANPSVSVGRDANKNDILAPVSADFRSWGGQYWFQNTRPMYWPMLAEGDFDMMQPLFRQYLGEMRNNEPVVKQQYHHDGSYFAETSPWWGAIGYWPPEKAGAYTDFYFTPVLELSMMMLDYADFTGDRNFIAEMLLPVASRGVTFFDQHFGRDASGKLLLDPDNAIEMYWKVHDPAPDIAGLRAVLPRLLALPQDLTTQGERQQWQRLLGEVPPLPEGDKNGKRVLLPYTGPQTERTHNSENPELYSIYPFRLFGLDKPQVEMARDTFAERLIKTTGCWVQDPVQAAFLGDAALAKRDVIFDLTRKDKRVRFPAFWDQGHDYFPDEDNGGNGQMALQTMLLQADDHKILLTPAWPKEWNADFRLHAPEQTVIEGRVERGKLSRLVVTPTSRRNDVQVLTPQ